MQANPLLGGGGAAKPEETPANEDQRVISLVSNVPADQITDLGHFHSFFNSPEVKAEVNPFRYVIQRKSRRSLGGKFSSGLSHEVTESVEINPNEDLFGLRRWLGGIRQDPASVLLLQVNKLKESPLAAPLIFSDLMKTGRPILLTGADRTTQDQLFAKIVPDCSSIPATVAQNGSLRTMLLARVQRRKGFAGTMRYLLDLEFLPKAVMEKIVKINSGGDPSELSEPEIINISLLSDLSSRYQNALQQYKETLDNSSLNVQQIMSMFEILMADVPLDYAEKAFKDYLVSEDGNETKIRSKSDLYAYLNQYINSKEGGSRAATRSQKLDDVFKRLTSVVIRQRVKVDPILWRRCNFIFKPDEDEKKLLSNLEPLHAFIKNTMDGGEEAITEDFKQKMGEAVYELVTLSNLSLEEVEKNGGLVRQRAAQHILPLFQMAKFQANHLVKVSEHNRETLLDKNKFLNLFKNTPMTVADLKLVWDKINLELNRDQMITQAIRSSTLDVLVGHTKDREKALREIYIVNAAQELVNFSFHFGDKNITGIDRLCGMAVMGQRFGFEVTANPAHDNSIGLFVNDDEAPLGKLQNEASVLSRAYTALIGIQLERQVKKLVDHKIGYLQATFGDNFFEVIYQNVVTRLDLPLSRNQLAWFVKEHGLLGSLMEKGFKSERENDLVDSFLTLDKATISAKGPERDFREFDAFEQKFKVANHNFKKMLADMKSHADQDPAQDIKCLIWSLYKRGIYNLERNEAKELFRRSEFYNTWKDLIAKISSENYSIFTKDIQEEGVKIYLMAQFHKLLTIGTRFGYMIESKIVRYQVIGSPAETLEELDPVSRVFNEKLLSISQDLDNQPNFKSFFDATEKAAVATEVWREYGRHLAFALLDRFLGETVIKQLQPGKVMPNNLWYLPDAVKLGLGPSLSAQNSVPFQKILQVPENMGNLQKNPKSCSTTIDDFTIEVHKITRLREELENLESVSEDVMDIVQNLTHERAESQLVLKYEQALGQMIRILSKPIRHYAEKEVQALHTVASLMKSTLQAFYSTPGTTKDQLVMRVQSQLQTRRSDGHTLKLNFTDAFILEKTEIRVMQKVKQGDTTVSKQRRVEVEVDASYQTLSARIREVIRTHEILGRKRHIVFSPEGQKKKQVEYVLDIIEIMQALRGNALKFYVDSSMLTDDQMQHLATRIKPHHFFRMNDLKPEAPEGIKMEGAKDPLTGRMVRKPPRAQPPPPTV